MCYVSVCTQVCTYVHMHCMNVKKSLKYPAVDTWHAYENSDTSSLSLFVSLRFSKDSLVTKNKTQFYATYGNSTNLVCQSVFRLNYTHLHNLPEWQQKSISGFVSLWYRFLFQKLLVGKSFVIILLAQLIFIVLT